jgi:hypothetical protein
MNINEIKTKICQEEYVYTYHAEIERQADDLTFTQIETALLNGENIEEYVDDRRGESCLILGYAEDVPIHIVCGWRGEKVAIITVYIPKPPKFINLKTKCLIHIKLLQTMEVKKLQETNFHQGFDLKNQWG